MLAPQIHHVRIERFRRVRDVIELDLRTPRGSPSPLVVLAGPNGCGKTTVLEAILLGLGQESLIVRDLDPTEREGSWRTSVPEEARIEIVASCGAGEERWVRTASEHTRTKSDGAVELLDHRDVTTRYAMVVEYFSSWRAPKLVGAVKPMTQGRSPSDTETNRLWRLKQRLAGEFIRAGVEGTANNKPKMWLERLNRSWARFHREEVTRLTPKLDDDPEGTLRFDLEVKHGDEPVCSIDQVSSGEIEILSFAQWVILNNVEAGLLLIDEPELHLHASWQATILPALRELAPKVQILAATHSDAVWDQAGERFLLVDARDPRSREWRARQPTMPEEAAS